MCGGPVAQIACVLPGSVWAHVGLTARAVLGEYGADADSGSAEIVLAGEPLVEPGDLAFEHPQV